MAKGQKTICTNNWFFYYCSVNETRRHFQLKKDFDIYLKRHQKSCSCVYIPANENEYGSRKPNELIEIK